MQPGFSARQRWTRVEDKSDGVNRKAEDFIRRFKEELKLQHVSKRRRFCKQREEESGRLQEVESGPHVLDQMEEHLTEKRRENVRMEMKMRGEKDERVIKGEIALSDAKLKSAITRVEHVLNCLDPEILNDQAPQLYGKKEERSSPADLDDHKEEVLPYKKVKSHEDPNRLRYFKHEIKTTAELLEKLFQEVDETQSFTATWRYKELRELNHFLLNFIQKWESTFLEKRAESSVEGGGQSQSKGVVVSKRNALRRQHNTQRDDPEELFPDLLELETILEDCLFEFPQPPKFITASAVGLGYTPMAMAILAV